jgi:DNA-binding transcriptional MerR regulator
MEGFRTPQVAQLTGVNAKTLHYWDVSGFISPSIAPSRGTGTRRVYSFQDLVALRVARELRAAGISLQGLREVVSFLRRSKDVRHPMAEAFLVTDGKDVFTRQGNALLSVLRKPGQGLLFQVVNLTRTVNELHQAALRLEASSATQCSDSTPRAV